MWDQTVQVVTPDRHESPSILTFFLTATILAKTTSERLKNGTGTGVQGEIKIARLPALRKGGNAKNPSRSKPENQARGNQKTHPKTYFPQGTPQAPPGHPQGFPQGSAGPPKSEPPRLRKLTLAQRRAPPAGPKKTIQEIGK